MTEEDLELQAEGAAARRVLEYTERFIDSSKSKIEKIAFDALASGELDGNRAIGLWAELRAVNGFDADLRKLVRRGSAASSRLTERTRSK